MGDGHRLYLCRERGGAAREDTLSADDKALRETLLARAKAKELPAIDFSARAVKYVIAAAVQTRFPEPKSARRTDRVTFASWQEVLDFEAPDTAEVTLGDLDWLRGVLDEVLDGDEKGERVLPMELALWLVRTAEYVEALYGSAIAALQQDPPAGEAAVPRGEA